MRSRSGPAPSRRRDRAVEGEQARRRGRGRRRGPRTVRVVRTQVDHLGEAPRHIDGPPSATAGSHRRARPGRRRPGPPAAHHRPTAARRGRSCAASTPTTTSRPGSRPSARPSSTSSARPSAWVPPRPVRRHRGLTGRPSRPVSQPVHRARGSRRSGPRRRRRPGRGPPTGRAGRSGPRARRPATPGQLGRDGPGDRRPDGVVATVRVPRPMTERARGRTGRSRPLHGEVEEVGGARDARVVVADRLLAPVLQRVRRPGRTRPATIARRSASMPAWFCEVGGTIWASWMMPGVVEHVAVEQHAARAPRWRRTPPRPAAGTGTLAAPRAGPAVDDPQRLVAGLDQLDGAHDDRAERVAAGGAEPGIGCAASPGERGEPVGVQGVAGQRADDVRPAHAAVEPGVQRVGVRARAPRRSGSAKSRHVEGLHPLVVTTLPDSIG